MPYFKNEKGAKGYVNDEEVMVRLEKNGYVRLGGKELFLRIVIEACKKWGIPALAATALYHFTGEFMLSLFIFAFVQKLLG